MSIKLQRDHQKGAAMVEFAIVAWVFFLVLFGVIEFGRFLFTLNTLTEIARRGARVAAVCPPNHPAIKNVAIFSNSSGTSKGILPGITTANIKLDYLNSAGTELTNLSYPIPATPSATFLNEWNALIQGGSVRVNIINYSHRLLIPINLPLIASASFSTKLAPEALGVVNTGTTGTGTDICSFP